MTIVFLRIAGWECVNRGRRSDKTDRARDGVMTWGNVIIGRDIVVIEVEVKSYTSSVFVLELSTNLVPFSEGWSPTSRPLYPAGSFALLLGIPLVSGGTSQRT